MRALPRGDRALPAEADYISVTYGAAVEHRGITRIAEDIQCSLGTTALPHLGELCRIDEGTVAALLMRMESKDREKCPGTSRQAAGGAGLRRLPMISEYAYQISLSRTSGPARKVLYRIFLFDLNLLY